MMEIIKKLFESRKFLVMLSAMIATSLTMGLSHFVDDENAKMIAKELSWYIVTMASVYIGAQGIADYGDGTYGKYRKEIINDIKASKEAKIIDRMLLDSARQAIKESQSDDKNKAG